MAATTTIRNLAKRLHLGRTAMRFYYQPLGRVRRSIAEGGPWEQRRTELGRQEMLAAAASLPCLASPATDQGARVSFLSGARFWYQTLFCFVSLQLQAAERITPVIYDDGTLSDETKDLFARVVPWVEFVDHAEIVDRLEQSLPLDSFPFLRARRLEYFHLRKLTDIHLGATNWTMVLDSDMLFFRRPDAVLSWFRRPHSMFMQDIATSYGYSDCLMSELASGRLHERVNVGLYALHSPSIDWARVEHACRTQIEREGKHYFQEQALTALLLSETEAVRLPAADYIVWPSLEEGTAPAGVLHHYVEQSKRSYFQSGWRRVAALLEQQASR